MFLLENIKELQRLCKVQRQSLGILGRKSQFMWGVRAKALCQSEGTRFQANEWVVFVMEIWERTSKRKPLLKVPCTTVAVLFVTSHTSVWEGSFGVVQKNTCFSQQPTGLRRKFLRSRCLRTLKRSVGLFFRQNNNTKSIRYWTCSPAVNPKLNLLHLALLLGLFNVTETS